DGQRLRDVARNDRRRRELALQRRVAESLALLIDAARDLELLECNVPDWRRAHFATRFAQPRRHPAEDLGEAFEETGIARFGDVADERDVGHRARDGDVEQTLELRLLAQSGD